ncbi:hypothetical protein [Bartonella taylorii]|uniref:Uncharacterized protein n=1 Tax=Bartonella taylorii TaxID=33046 RepID=A0A9Q9DMG7_BARTA|nr:hypothetical protein [Bartonella taylorii]OPB34984.1 adenine-specific DNA-methyltransferase [Bartonella taylorii]USP02738.1 hypothetical protein LAJ60_07745 [Bartonella taylorii]
MSVIASENKIEGLSQSPQEQGIAKLKAAFPQCFVEGKLDKDQLLNL